MSSNENDDKVGEESIPIPEKTAEEIIEEVKNSTDLNLPETQEILNSVTGGDTSRIKDMNSFYQTLAALNHMQQKQTAAIFKPTKDRKKVYRFWSSQPVAQFDEDPMAQNLKEGPVDVDKEVDDVRDNPYHLPDGFEWCNCDVSEENVVKEVYELLTNNYVEDDDNMFRFNYSAGFLQWALLPPEQLKEWLVGVRVTKSQKLVGFISAIPAKVRVNENVISMAEVNFLCVHKKLRSKRLAPVLIKEITRRVNKQNIWQAVYTAGVVLPKPIGTCRYYHRTLNQKKLVDVGFSKLSNKMTMARLIRLNKLPVETKIEGIRPMEEGDISKIEPLLNTYLQKYKLAPYLSEEDIKHWLLPRKNVIYTYVVENKENKEITDLVSFYSLPSSVLGNKNHSSLEAAYMYYTVPNAHSLMMLMTDALILAKNNGFDVFNALDILENESFLKDLKFGEGDGFLRYYLYNWRILHEFKSSDIGLILL